MLKRAPVIDLTDEQPPLKKQTLHNIHEIQREDLSSIEGKGQTIAAQLVYYLNNFQFIFINEKNRLNCQ